MTYLDSLFQSVFYTWHHIITSCNTSTNISHLKMFSLFQHIWKMFNVWHHINSKFHLSFQGWQNIAELVYSQLDNILSFVLHKFNYSKTLWLICPGRKWRRWKDVIASTPVWFQSGDQIIKLSFFDIEAAARLTSVWSWKDFSF